MYFFKWAILAIILFIFVLFSLQLKFVRMMVGTNGFTGGFHRVSVL